MKNLKGDKGKKSVSRAHLCSSSTVLGIVKQWCKGSESTC